MRKWLNIIFISLAGLICVIPLFGMIFTVKDSTVNENRRLASMPQLISEGRLNTNYLPLLGAYYEDHFGFRNEAVAANSALIAGVFGVSPVDTIVKGEGDWLYYKDSLSDFRRDSVISEREAFAIAHNIALVQQNLEGQGIDFLFTIAPNKNSLYGEHMPYYYDYKMQ